VSTEALTKVAEAMNSRYAAGTAYQEILEFDRIRTQKIREAVLYLARPSPQTRILDVGCGVNGFASCWDYPALHSHIVATDISAEAIKQAKEKFPGPEYLVGPIETVDLGDRNSHKLFDCVIAQESIEHWVDVPAGLKNIRSHMSDIGKLVLSTPNRDSLHCRMARKFGREAPLISPDHVHEFGFQELIETVCDHGFVHEQALGVHMAPYWALEDIIGHQFRNLTDNDPEVNEWLNDIAEAVPAYAFIQVHLFQAA